MTISAFLSCSTSLIRMVAAAFLLIAVGTQSAAAQDLFSGDDKRDHEDVKKQKMQLLLKTEGQTTRGGIAKSKVKNGVRTTPYKDIANYHELIIVEDPKKGISMRFTRSYSANDVNQLKNEHPELVDYVDLFPKSTGEHEIELELKIKTSFNATNIHQLRAKSKKAYDVYEAHARRQGDFLSQFGW